MKQRIVGKLCMFCLVGCYLDLERSCQELSTRTDILFKQTLCSDGQGDLCVRVQIISVSMVIFLYVLL